MTKIDSHYSFGRALPIFFISAFLGMVWGVTAVLLLGLMTWFAQGSFGTWTFLSGATLIVSLAVVGKVAGRAAPAADETEISKTRIDCFLSMIWFAVAYLVAWALIWEIVREFPTHW